MYYCTPDVRTGGAVGLCSITSYHSHKCVRDSVSGPSRRKLGHKPSPYARKGLQSELSAFTDC